MIAVLLVMAADLGTWLLVPAGVRAGESNALVPYVSPLVLKVVAVLVIGAVVARLDAHRRAGAVRLVVGITSVGIATNLVGLLP
jgi:Co/Zn/Cd efflux system component